MISDSMCISIVKMRQVHCERKVAYKRSLLVAARFNGKGSSKQ